MRIVSLVPSLTEAVCDLGRRGSLVGCTKFCMQPAGLHRDTTLVGGTKDPDLGVIRDLHASHVIVNTEENRREDIEALRDAGVAVLETFPKSPHDVPDLLRTMGAFLGVPDEAERQALDLERALADLPAVHCSRDCIYFIWRAPYMLVGPDTYIARALQLMGLRAKVPDPPSTAPTTRAAERAQRRYPEARPEWLSTVSAKIALLSSEPFPFRQRHADELRSLLPAQVEIAKIDGQLLSWYGSRTRRAVAAIADYLEGRENALVTPVAHRADDR